ncbi:hypothetical protein D021_1224B, partial [Vibrio parahaemolyticus 10296]
FF